jgi:hypothetical protein
MRNVSLLLVGALGVVGTASARPFDPPERQGRLPAGVVRAEIAVRVSHDDGDRAPLGGRQKIDPISHHAGAPDAAFSRGHHVLLPIKSEIVQRVSLGDGHDGQHNAASAERAVAMTQGDGGNARGGVAKLPLKSEILLRVADEDGPESTRWSSSRTPRATGSQGGISQGTISDMLASMSVKPPKFMLVELMAGKKHVEFDDPKIDRQGIWSGGDRTRAARAQTQKSVSTAEHSK